tara:strand:+ start:1479 stop:2873 length:1395 start_codon:yes stop_codon:yes gene_type:complete
MDGGSAAVNAGAGSGKSHTAKALSHNYDDKVFFYPFMVSLRKEQQEAFKDASHVTVNNVHSVGKSLLGRTKVNNKKCFQIASNLYGKAGRKVSDLVSKLKTEGFGVYDGALTIAETAAKYAIALKDAEQGAESLAEMAQVVLDESDAMYSEIDFDDMLRMPILLGKTRNSDGLVVLDEVQDFTPAIWTLVRDCLTTADSRVFMIGDPERQALMMFAGAKPEIFNEMSDHYGCKSFDLTVNRRCAKAIVRNAPFSGNMVALDDAPEGEVTTQLKCEVIDEIRDGGHALSAMLCETNAPIVTLGIKLLTSGVPVRMRTGRLDSMLLRYAAQHMFNRDLNVGDITLLIQKDLEAAAKEGVDVTEFQDVVLCIAELENWCLANNILKTTYVYKRPQHPLQQAIAILTSGTTGISLMTGHTSKGLEWDTVFHLPAKTREPVAEWEIKQAECVQHVIATRPRLKFVTLVD